MGKSWIILFFFIFSTSYGSEKLLKDYMKMLQKAWNRLYNYSNYVTWTGQQRVNNLVKPQFYINVYRDPTQPEARFINYLVEPATLAAGPNGKNLKVPVIIMISDYNPRLETFESTEMSWAMRLGSKGYFVYVIDVIGTNISTTDTSDNWVYADDQEKYRQTVFNRLKNDRKGALQSRLSLALAQIGSTELQSYFQLKTFDFDNIIVLGIGFGGLSALDVARTSLGNGFKGVACIHGDLTGFDDGQKIRKSPPKPKILALYGHEDKERSKQGKQFQIEMNKINADWQLYVFGDGTKEEFTKMPAYGGPDTSNEKTNYHAKSSLRSFDMFVKFVEDVTK